MWAGLAFGKVKLGGEQTEGPQFDSDSDSEDLFAKFNSKESV